MPSFRNYQNITTELQLIVRSLLDWWLGLPLLLPIVLVYLSILFYLTYIVSQFVITMKNTLQLATFNILIKNEFEFVVLE